MPPSNINEAHITKMMQQIHSLVTTVNSINAKVDRLMTSVRLLSDIIVEDVEASQQIAAKTETATQLLQAAQKSRKSMWERQPLPLEDAPPTEAPDHGQQTC